MLDVATRFVPGQMARLWKSLPTGAMLRAATRSSEVNRRLIKTTDLAEYLRRMNNLDFRVALSMLEGAGRHDASDYLEEISVPTLVVAGRNDTFTPPDRSSLMAAMIPNAQVMMVNGGTHSLPIEQPDLVNLRVRRFLRERIGEPDSTN